MIHQEGCPILEASLHQRAHSPTTTSFIPADDVLVLHQRQLSHTSGPALTAHPPALGKNPSRASTITVVIVRALRRTMVRAADGNILVAGMRHITIASVTSPPNQTGGGARSP